MKTTPTIAARMVRVLIQDRRYAFYPAMIEVCSLTGCSYESVRSAYYPGDPMPHAIYNSHGQTA